MNNLQILFTVELMKAERDDKGAELDSAFEQALFIHDRPLWQKAYEPEPEEIEQGVEWVTRENPAEFAEMMAELEELGVLAES